MNANNETMLLSGEQDEPTSMAPASERSLPPTRLLQILKALEVEAASDVHDILRRSRASHR